MTSGQGPPLCAFCAHRVGDAQITTLCDQKFHTRIPILVHGYDYPVPDGRGFWGGWPFPGPWLQPGFYEKNFTDLQRMTDMMRDIMDRFNTMVAGLSALPGFAHVRYVNLRGTLSDKLTDYKQWWDNELHPNKQGFEAVAKKFAAAI